MKIHPSAEALPLMEGADLAELAADIKAHGLIHPIITLDGAILDGRNRWRACQKIGVEPTLKPWHSSNGMSPTEYVLAANLHRRHLTPSQKAAIAAELLPRFEEEAKQRQAAGQKAGGKARHGQHGATTGTKQEPAKARDVAAKAVGVSHSLVSRAKRIKEKAPEVHERIKTGEVTLSQAERKVFPTVAEEVKAHPGTRWDDLIGRLSTLLNSLDRLGGIRKARTNWPKGPIREQMRDKLRRMSNQLAKAAEDL